MTTNSNCNSSSSNFSLRSLSPSPSLRLPKRNRKLVLAQAPPNKPLSLFNTKLTLKLKLSRLLILRELLRLHNCTLMLIRNLLPQLAKLKLNRIHINTHTSSNRMHKRSLHLKLKDRLPPKPKANPSRLFLMFSLRV